MSFVRFGKRIVRPGVTPFDKQNADPEKDQPPKTTTEVPASHEPRVPEQLPYPQNMTGIRTWVNGLIQTSSGVPDLDHAIGGGITAGTFIGWLPDRNTTFAKDAFIRAFISEGLLHGHTTIFVDPESRPKELASESSSSSLAFTLSDVVQLELSSNPPEASTDVFQASRKGGKIYDSLCEAIRPLRRTLKFNEWFSEAKFEPSSKSSQDVQTTNEANKGKSINRLTMLSIAEDEEEEDEEEGGSNTFEMEHNEAKNNLKKSTEKKIGSIEEIIEEEDDEKDGNGEGGNFDGRKAAPTSLTPTRTVGEMDAAANEADGTGSLKIAWQYNKYVRPLDASANLAPSVQMKLARDKATIEDTNSGPEGKDHRRPIYIVKCAQKNVLKNSLQNDHGIVNMPKYGGLPRFSCLTQSTGEVQQKSRSVGEYVDATLKEIMQILKREHCLVQGLPGSNAFAGGFARLVISCEPFLSSWSEEADSSQRSSYAHFMRFLHGVQTLVRKTRAIVCLLAPRATDSPAAQSLRNLVMHFSDTLISLQSFGDDVWCQRGEVTAFGDFDGFITLLKFSRPKSLVPPFSLPETPHLLFKRNPKSSRPLRLQRMALAAENSRAGDGSAPPQPNTSEKSNPESKAVAAKAADMF